MRWLQIVGGAICVAVVVKALAIGFSSSEAPWLVVGGVIGAALLKVGQE
jgi:hypothetical protein